MRIKWSSTAAQETISCLSRVNTGLEDCLNQTARIRAALVEANPDGENKILQKFSEVYESCEKKLRNLKEDFGEYARAIEKADELFQETESHIAHQVDDLSEAEEAPVYVQGAGYILWSSDSLFILPDMRIRGPVPAWLIDAASETYGS